jgi:predicted HicB family RNase H-like nuclease
MAKSLDRSDWVQLATRIPKRLHRAMKLECVTREESLQAWLLDALEAHLARCRGARQRAAE